MDREINLSKGKINEGLIATAIIWNSKQVWKGLGCGEGKNLSLKGFPLPASKILKPIEIASYNYIFHEGKNIFESSNKNT
jgi:hypothetical protein